MLHCLSERTLEAAPATNPPYLQPNHPPQLPCQNATCLETCSPRELSLAVSFAHSPRFLLHLQLSHLEDISVWLNVLLRTQQTLCIVLPVSAVSFCKHYLFSLGVCSLVSSSSSSLPRAISLSCALDGCSSSDSTWAVRVCRGASLSVSHQSSDIWGLETKRDLFRPWIQIDGCSSNCGYFIFFPSRHSYSVCTQQSYEIFKQEHNEKSTNRWWALSWNPKSKITLVS